MGDRSGGQAFLISRTPDFIRLFRWQIPLPQRRTTDAWGTDHPLAASLRSVSVCASSLSAHESLVVHPGVPLQFGDWDQDASAHSPHIEFAIRDQVVETSLTDRKVLGGISAIDQQALFRRQCSTSNRFLLAGL
jgi:hypothetical protein